MESHTMQISITILILAEILVGIFILISEHEHEDHWFEIIEFLEIIEISILVVFSI